MTDSAPHDKRVLHAQIGNVTACIVTAWGQVLTHITLVPYSRAKLGMQALFFVVIALVLYAYVWRRLPSLGRLVAVIMICVNLWTIVLAAGALL